LTAPAQVGGWISARANQINASMPGLSSNRGMQLSIGPATLPTLVDGFKKPPMATMLPLVSISRLSIPALPDSAVVILRPPPNVNPTSRWY